MTPRGSELKSPPKKKEASGRSPKRGRRRLLIVAAALLLGLPLLLLLLSWALINPIAKAAVERLTGNALDVPVRLDRAQLRLAQGLMLHRLRVPNPPGYHEPEAFFCERIEVQTRVSRILGNPIEIQDLALVRPEFTLDFNEKRSNWGAMFRTLTKPDKSAKPAPATPAPDDSRETKLIIHRIRLIRPALRVGVSPLLPDGKLFELKDITLDQVGNTPGAASPISLVLATIFQALLTGDWIDEGKLPKQFRSSLQGEVEEAAKAFKSVVKPGK